MKTNQEIAFKLVNIKTIEFAVIENESINEDTLESFVEIGFGFSDKTGRIQCGIKFKLSTDDKPFIIIHINCTFEIEPTAWEAMYDDKKEAYILPIWLAKHLAVLVMGTTRGALHAKTEGTIFNKYFIPPMNIDEQIEEDVVLPVN
jgi:hypothetical protein